uniref:Uncharacterized protein n=1 Tax=Mycena chlorophos TaxID=658473 RepID=A0ABQ0MAW0_MYCCL|nr:predicted protein [Mycena chlorophos]
MKFHWPRIFRRRRTTSTGAGGSPKATVLRRSQSSPDLPRAAKPDNNLPAGVAQPVASMPVPAIERTEMPVPHPAEAPALTRVQMPIPQINVVGINGNAAGGPSVAASVVVPATPGTPDTLGIPDELEMWHGVEGARSKGKVEKGMDQMDKDAQTVKNRLSDAHNAVSFVKDLASNELVQDIGKKVLAGIPQLMNGLEELSKVHPFIRVAYLPFKYIYLQETERRENDDRRMKLFEYIKDVMLVLLELKNLSKADQDRQTPEGTTIGRVKQVCKSMRKDILQCYNVLNAQEKRSFSIKFLKASIWGKELATYADRFTKRRSELQFALTMRIAVKVDEVNEKLTLVRLTKMFAAMASPQERQIGDWIRHNGNAEAVLKSDSKCAKLLEFEATLPGSTSRAPHGAQAASPAKTEEDKRQSGQKAITALRKEYKEDIHQIIQDNFQVFSAKFQVSLDSLARDLGEKIEHQGDRVIDYLERSGPKSRIKNKIVYHVWKDQVTQVCSKLYFLLIVM